MTFGAWKTGRLPLMRDGTQWRPMVHVSDTARALTFMADCDADAVRGEIFNVGSAANVYQIGPLGDLVAARVADITGRDVAVEWYGDPDHRSYRVSFGKIEALGWRAQKTAEDGVAEIVERLEAGTLDKTTETLTLDWYKALVAWRERIRAVEMHGGIVDID
jgi:nucleoside-diphosphate-sugar epimerase